MKAIETFNRTIVELKLSTGLFLRIIQRTFNRTIVELKLNLSSRMNEVTLLLIVP